MAYSKCGLTFLLVVGLQVLLYSQTAPATFEIESQTIGSTNNSVPFWFRSNRYGSTPTAGGLSAAFITKGQKDYKNNNNNFFDWGAGFEGRANLGRESKLFLIEGYAKARAGIFQLKAGRTKDLMGLNGDSILSSGNFSISGNALGIPKIEISIPEFYRIPVLGGLFSIKGNFAHGWAGKKPIKDTLKYGLDPTVSLVSEASVFLHQKSFYVQLGKPNWRLQLFGGFSHQAFWGSEKKIYGDDFTLSSFETLSYVVFGKAYGNTNIPYSKIGNQIGSIDLSLKYRFDRLNLQIYRQNFYDVGALSRLANIKDGLNGIVIENKTVLQSRPKFRWEKILLEFLYTKNQAGELNSKYTKSGDEDYYNNYFYTDGWSYNGMGLGTPFISPKTSVKKGQASDPKDFFINNRVVAFHTGLQAAINDIQLTSKLSFSRNFGTYGTNSLGHSLGNIRIPPVYGIFEKQNQFSAYLGFAKNYKSGMMIGSELAIDHGGLLNNSMGLILKVSKKFSIGD